MKVPNHPFPDPKFRFSASENNESHDGSTTASDINLSRKSKNTKEKQNEP